MEKGLRLLFTSILVGIGACASNSPAPPLPELPKIKHNAGLVVVIDKDTVERKHTERVDFSNFQIFPGQILKQVADEEMPLMFSHYNHTAEYREPSQGEPKITVVLSIKDFAFRAKTEAAARTIVAAHAYGPNRQKLFSSAYVETGTSYLTKMRIVGSLGNIDDMTRESTQVAMKRVFGKLRTDLERVLTTGTTAARVTTPAASPLTLTSRKRLDLAKFNSVRVVCSIPQERVIAQSENLRTPYSYGSTPVVYPNNPALQGHVDAMAGVAVTVIGEIRTKKAYRSAQKDIDFLQQRIPDVDYRRDFCGRLKNAVLSAGWKQIGDIVIDDKGASEYWEDESFDKLFGSESEDALLVVSGFYSLQKPDYAVFESVIQTSLWHRKERRKIHTGRYVYLSEPVDNQTKRVAVGTWADQSGRLYRAAVKQSIDETLSLMRTDLFDRDLPENRTTGELQFLNMDLGGRVIQKSIHREKRVMIEGPGGYYSGPRLTSEGGELESLAVTLERIQQNAKNTGSR